MTLSTSVDTNKDVVGRFVACYNRADLEAMVELFTQDATWTHNGSIDLSGAHVGRDAIIANLMAPSYELFEPGTLRLDVSCIIGEGDVVALEFTARGTGKATGREYENPYGVFFTIRDGLIVEVHEYVDTEHSKDVLY